MSYRRRRGRRGGLTVGEYLRSFVIGVAIMGLAGTLMALAGAAANSLSGYAAFNITIGTNTVTIDLGVIPPIVIGVGSVLLFLYGFRRVARVRI